MRDIDDQPALVSKLSFRRLLSNLTAVALTTTALGPAAAAATTTTDLSSALEDEREIDHERLDPQVAAAALGRGLALALGKVRPLDATQLAATWSLSGDPMRRLSLGLALGWSFPLVGDALIIDHLSRDAEPSVRAAAAQAAWFRRTGGVDEGILARLADDPDPHVRAVAQAARARP